MLTEAGPRLIEYNCRFGDPEAQAILPLVMSDLLELLHSAAVGRLADTPVEVASSTSAAIVVAADGYPTDPRSEVPIPDVVVPHDVQLLHAGTGYKGDQLVSCGGRVLTVVGLGSDLAQALDRAYPVVDQLVGNGLFARSRYRKPPCPEDEQQCCLRRSQCVVHSRRGNRRPYRGLGDLDPR